MTLSIDEITRYERERRELLLGEEAFHKRWVAASQLRPQLDAQQKEAFYKGAVSWFRGRKPQIKASTFARLERVAAGSDGKTTSSRESLSSAQEYVSTLLDVDLSACAYVCVPTHEWRAACGDHAEATSYPCGESMHVIVTPETMVDADSQLVHEYGHAAHTSLRRRTAELESWLPDPRVAEFVSYACQLQFISTSRSRREMAHALEALSRTYFAWLVFTKRDLTDAQFARDRQVREGFAQPPALLKEGRHSFSPAHLENLYFRMIGFGMAIRLVASGSVSGLREFALGNRLDGNVAALAQKCFGSNHSLFELHRLDESIRTLLE